MKMRWLEAFGIGADVIDVWEARYGTELLPVQEKAIKQHTLLQGGNLVVFAPTTSGKTFIGEMLAVSSVRKRKRVLYLVPTKALAEEKFTQFREAYQPLGITTAISTRDHREWDEAILTKGYDIAILVYEKLQSLLVTRPSLLEEIGVVILDELQMLSDEERGPAMEILLTKILQARIRPQILGLSAVLGQGEGLARWLSADLLIEEKRPVELRKGVFCRGIFSYREHNSRQEGEETWRTIPGEKEKDGGLTVKESEIMAPLACYLGEEKGESTLLFLKDKPTVEAVAGKIGERVALPPAKGAIQELLTLEETASRDFLIGLLKKGVGLHHTDLPWEQRELMERHFREGAIRILCSTSTLAMGINCPAKNVIIESRQWHYYRHYGRVDTRDLPRSIHENMAGRGGRFGFINDFGRAILVTPSPFTKKVWMNHYIQGEFEPLEPPLREEEIGEYLINLIASGEGMTAGEMVTFLASTYTASLRWREQTDAIRNGVETTLEKCLARGVIKRVGEGRFAATELGKITALKGIKLWTCLEMVKWMKETDPKNITDLEILFAMALTEDAKRVYIPLPYREQRGKNYRSRMQKEILHQQEEGKTLFKTLFGPMQQTAEEEARAIKKALLLSEWITPKATCEIEQAYEVHSGAIRRIGEEFSWLAEAASAIASAIGWPEGSVKKLSELSERLIYGVTAKGLGISRIRLRGLGRTYIARLVREGYDSPEAIFQLPVEVLQKLLPERLARQLYLHFHPEETARMREENKARPSAQVKEDPVSYTRIAPPDLPILSIDPGQQALSYRGIHADLSLFPFRFLLALARSPGKVVTKRDLYEAVYGSADGESEDDRPYERQLSDHKRKILTHIRKAVKRQKARGITAGEIKSLIAVRRGVGYALNLGSEEVSLSGIR